MLNNLNYELKRKNITQNAVARMLGVTDKTLTNKLNGTTAFTVEEAFSINKNLLPEFTMEYLFAPSADDGQSA